MIFMRALLIDGVQVCQVKAYYTELSTTCPCMALSGFSCGLLTQELKGIFDKVQAMV